MSKCRGCGAEIIWVFTEANKRMPLDAKSEKRFVLFNEQEPTGAVLIDTYISHFATCPNAKEFRHERSGGSGA